MSTTSIIYVVGSLDVGGAERHLVRVLPRLAKMGFSPTVYTFSNKGKLATLLDEAGIEVVEPVFAPAFRKLPSWVRRVLLLISAPSFLLLLLRRRPDFVHFFLPEAYLLGGICSLAFRLPIRIMSRRSLNRYQLEHPLAARVERWLHPHMDAVLGNSRAVVEELKQEGVGSDRLGLLYNGIDLVSFERLPPRDSIRQSLGVSDSAALMVCVANLIPYKGHADLIRALGKIRADLPDSWAIAMVGRDTGIGDGLRALAGECGVAQHILWLGERSDAVAIYAAADIGVLSSHQEGFSNSVLEGMAAGVAMVVTDVGGNREAVIDGACGIVVPAHDPSALSKAILRLILDAQMRERMAKAGRKRVAERFSLDACINQYAALYRALLADRHCSVPRALAGTEYMVVRT